MDLDARAMTEKLDAVLAGLELKTSITVGVSGCIQDCLKIFICNIGILAKNSSWSVAFGGNNGQYPEFGDIVAHNLGDEEVLVVEKCVNFYSSQSEEGETIPQFSKRVGIEAIREAVL